MAGVVVVSVKVHDDHNNDLPRPESMLPSTLPSRPAASTSSSPASRSNSYTFFDQAVIVVRAGSGGAGASTYQQHFDSNNNNNNRKRRTASPRGPPDGGSGGRGGHVVLVVDPSLNTLAGLATSSSSPKTFRAPHGANGEHRFRHGRRGSNVEIRVPPGTRVQQQQIRSTSSMEREEDNDATTTERDVDSVEWVDIGTVGFPDDPNNNSGGTISMASSTVSSSLIVALGGEGGDGNAVMESGASSRGARRPRAPPTGGQRHTLKLTLQLVADVALVAVPNAGKSTFLAAVTRAKPKIANYPFTTIVPNLGVWVPPEPTNDHNANENTTVEVTTTPASTTTTRGLVLCDVPGLIAGAADGVGLGHEFLRHVERCHVILHLIDATSPNPVADYEMINREIVNYSRVSSHRNSKLATLPQIVVVNKVDALDDYHPPAPSRHGGDTVAANTNDSHYWPVRRTRDELEAQLRAVMPHSRLLWMSARERDGVDQVMTRLAAFVQKVKTAAAAAAADENGAV